MEIAVRGLEGNGKTICFRLQFGLLVEDGEVHRFINI
jgi:hypothetical protein